MGREIESRQGITPYTPVGFEPLTFRSWGGCDATNPLICADCWPKAERRVRCYKLFSTGLRVPRDGSGVGGVVVGHAHHHAHHHANALSKEMMFPSDVFCSVPGRLSLLRSGIRPVLRNIVHLKTLHHLVLNTYLCILYCTYACLVYYDGNTTPVLRH
jgi:hypothetical protein